MTEQNVDHDPDLSSVSKVGARPNTMTPIANIVPGGLWLLAKVGPLGNSPIVRFVRSHSDRLLPIGGAMIGAGLLSATLDGLGLLPGSKPSAFLPAVAAAIAGMLATSPHLCSKLWFLTRVVRSAVATMLVTLGVGVVAAVLFWDRLGPMPPWTLDQAVAHLRADAPGIASCLFSLWGTVAVTRMMLGSFRSSPMSFLTADFTQLAIFDYEMAARHEAAHALVACVLGIPMTGAWVLRVPDARGNGGAVTIGQAPAAGRAEALYGLLARKMAVNVAGVAGARSTWSMDAILGELEQQRDWVQASELDWIAGSIHSHRDLVSEVLTAIVPVIRTKPWQDAIEEMAKVLLQANGDLVAPEVFAAAARRFGLALQPVEEIASGCP